jgi:glycerol transport system ATP-binding protein
MARIELVNLAHSYKAHPTSPSDYALLPMTMTWDDGGAYALLGPSGCGKTTLLNIISGLVIPSEGQVLFDGKDVTRLPTEARNIAQVFQFPVIYDTMTVRENLAFPLKNRGWKTADITKRVDQIAEILELTSDLKHRASGLTADAKQKISLGRGLVRPDVAAVLFDEPLTVIDPHLKWLLRRKLKEIHHELKLSLIYVTHDQVEAMTMGDRIAVFNNGNIEQLGSPLSLYEQPCNQFVASFLGSPRINLIEKPNFNMASEKLKAWWNLYSENFSTKPHCIAFRPEHIDIVEAAQGLPATVVLAEHLGDSSIYHCQVNGLTNLINVKMNSDKKFKSHDSIGLFFNKSHILGFDSKSHRVN